MGSVARAEPDGYTILPPPVLAPVNPALSDLPYDPSGFHHRLMLAVQLLLRMFCGHPDLGELDPMKEICRVAKASPKIQGFDAPIGTTPQRQVAVLKLAREGLNDATSCFPGGGDALMPCRPDRSAELRRAGPRILISRPGRSKLWP